MMGQARGKERGERLGGGANGGELNLNDAKEERHGKWCRNMSAMF